MISSLFSKLLPVQVLTYLLGTLNVMADGLFAGNFVGSAAMSAIGFYYPLSRIMITIGEVMFGGTQVVCGQFMGRNQSDKISGVFTLNIISVTAFGLLMGAVMYLFAGPMSSAFGAEGDAYVQLKGYIIGSAFSVIPQLLCQQFTSFLSMQRREKYVTVTSVLFIIISIVSNFLFVNILHLEMFGLALATAISYWIFAILLAASYFTKKSSIKFKIKEIEFKVLGKILKYGYVSALSSFYQIIRGFVLNYLLCRYGGMDAVAALAAYNTLGSFLFSFPLGIVSVYRLLASVSTGDEDRTMLKKVSKVAMMKFGLITLVFSVLICIFAVPCTYIFFRNPAETVFALTVLVFRIYPLSIAFSLICMLFVAYGQVMKKNALVQVLSFFDGLGGTLLFGFMLSPLFGFVGLLWTQVLNGIFTNVIVLIFAIAGKKRIPKNLEDLLCIPDGFGADDENRMDITLITLESVVKISEQIQEFCLSKNIDERRSYFAALSLEEMAGNVLKHGFTKDKRNHHVDVRVTNISENLTLRIMDDCPTFNPMEREKFFDPAHDKVSNIGVRIVHSLSSDMTYQNLLGLNVLTIKI